jgi:hypothetical protein
MWIWDDKSGVNHSLWSIVQCEETSLNSKRGSTRCRNILAQKHWQPINRDKSDVDLSDMNWSSLERPSCCRNNVYSVWVHGWTTMPSERLHTSWVLDLWSFNYWLSCTVCRSYLKFMSHIGMIVKYPVQGATWGITSCLFRRFISSCLTGHGVAPCDLSPEEQNRKLG